MGDLTMKKWIVAVLVFVPLAALLTWEAQGQKALLQEGHLISLAADEKSDGVLHGDTSTSEEELKELYGDKMPEDIMLMALSDKLPPVLFPHKKHVDMEKAHCGNCHHKNPNDVKGCYTCHPHEPEKEEVPAYKEAHHGLCHPCHKANNKGGKVPPVKCLDCHKKENKKKADKVNNNKP